MILLKKILPAAVLAGIAMIPGLAVACGHPFAAYCFGFFAVLFLLFISFRFPFFTYLLFIVSLPLEAVLVMDVGFTIRLSYVILAVLIASMIISGRKFRFASPLVLPILMFLAVCAVSLANNIFFPSPGVELASEVALRGSAMRPAVQLFYLFFMVSAYFVSFHFCSDRKIWGKVMKVFVFTAFVVAIYGIYQFFALKYGLPFVDMTNALSTTGSKIGVSYYRDPFLFRPHATFQEPLFFANYILSVLPLLLILFIFGSRRVSGKIGTAVAAIKPVLPMFLALTIAIILTKSRGAWIGLILAGIFIFLIFKTKEKIKLVSLAFLAVVIFCFFFVFEISNGGYNDFKEYFVGRFSAESLQKEPRLSDLDFALDLWWKYPIFGVGIGNYNFYAADYYNVKTMPVAPNIWTQTLAETGIFGFGALFFLIISCGMVLTRALIISAGTAWYPYAAGYLACFIGMMGQYLFSFDRLPLFFWVFMGISVAAAGLIEKTNVFPELKTCDNLKKY